MDEAKRARELLGRVSAALADHKKKGYLLDAIAWPRAVEEAFFASRATRLPEGIAHRSRPGVLGTITDSSRERGA